MLVNKPRAYEVMDKYGLDGLVACDPVNIYYLTDFSSPLQKMGLNFTSYAVLPRAEEAPAALVVPTTALNHLERTPSWVPNICTFSFPKNLMTADPGEAPMDPAKLEPFPRAMPWPGRDKVLYDKRDVRLAELYSAAERGLKATSGLGLKKALDDAGLSRGRVGFDDPRVLAWQNDLGLAGLGGMDAYNIFREIRMVKSEAEIELIKLAGQKNEQAVNAAIDAIAPGVPIAEVERVHKMKWAELDGQANFLVVSIRGLSSGEILADELIKLDGTGFYRNYIGDIGRTVVCGNPTPTMLRRNKAVMKGLELAYELICPGASGREVSQKVIELVHQEGFPGFLAASPHSVGLTHTDHPWPVGTDLPSTHGEFVYLENMVFTLDMPHHEFGWGTMHVEDMLIVRRDGCEPITSLNTALRVKPES